jgi:hypothetical protein
VRRWHACLTSDLRAELAPSGRDGSATVPTAYRLLRAILQTAADDELLLRNSPSRGVELNLELGSRLGVRLPRGEALPTGRPGWITGNL